MVKAYFSRQVPFYLMPIHTNSDETFDAVVVEVDVEVLDMAMALRGTIKLMEERFAEAPAYEETAQEEYNYFSELLLERPLTCLEAAYHGE